MNRIESLLKERLTNIQNNDPSLSDELKILRQKRAAATEMVFEGTLAHDSNSRGNRHSDGLSPDLALETIVLKTGRPRLHGISQRGSTGIPRCG